MRCGGWWLPSFLALHRLGRLRGPRQAASPCVAGSSLLDANTNEVPAIVAGHGFVSPLDRPAAARSRCARPKPDKDARKQLHASLALLPVDATQVDYLYGRLLDAEPHEVPVIRDALAPHKDELLDKLWAVVETPEKGKESQRLRAAAALAKYDPESEKWAKAERPRRQRVWLPKCPAVFLATWMESLSPRAGPTLPAGQLARLSRCHSPGNWSGRSRRTFSLTMPPTSRRFWPTC